MSGAIRSRRVVGFRTVRGRMLFWILAVTMPIYAGALYLSYRVTAQRLEAGAQRDADNLAARLATSLDAVIRPIEGGIRTVAHQLEEVDPPPVQYPQRIRGILAAWPDVYGSTIAVETRTGDANASPFAPYLYRRGASVASSDLAGASYVYQERPWYRRAADAGRPVWSSPYFDAGGGDIWMVTYSVPFFRKQGDTHRAIAGVVTADLDLKWVTDTAAHVDLGPMGMGWLSSPPTPRSFVAPIGATTERLGRFAGSIAGSINEEAIREFGEGMLKRNTTFELLPGSVVTSPTFLAARHLETLDWRLMLIVPRDELMSEAHSLLNRQLALGAIGLVGLVAAIMLVASGITKPIRALADAVGKAREGDFDLHVPETRRRDEVGVLADALRRMRDSLQRHIHLRAATLAEQGRLDHELAIAARIQQSMLPRPDSGTALPRAARIAAALLPAKQVGGDFYEYFERRDGSVLFAIGDVSDKGIPAALFMARVSALLRELGGAGESPDDLLAGVNARLVDGNETAMFVTVGCGVLDVHTGRISYASAGHDAPLLRTLEGTVMPLSMDTGPAIGIDTDVQYPLGEAFIAPGDRLVLFTDGVTEADAGDGSLFGLERLSAVLRDARDSEPHALVREIVDAVAAHASAFHASDDLTLMTVSLSLPQVTARSEAGVPHWLIEPEASSAGVIQAQQSLRTILTARGVEPGRIGDTELIAEEVLTNIVRAARSQSGDVHLSLACTLTPGEIALTVRDSGAAFDPIAFARPNIDGNIVDREVGGLGILLVRQLADSCQYSRIDGCNVLDIRLSR